MIWHSKSSYTLFFLILCFHSLGQKKSYPKNYFRNPLNIPILLAGNFGECRPGHFHSGIDIKTQGKENLPVYAAAEGYISRIKMDPGGFGHALYITHPNGYTSLYAHLNHFNPSLQKLVRQKQYALKSWTLDISFKPEEYPVKKGQFIAYSGNTGGSTAPHLHFEIRDTKTEHPLNPQLFGFDIHDKKAPIPSHIAIYDALQSIYDQDVNTYKLIKKGATYSTQKDTLYCYSNQMQLGIAVMDYMEASQNTLSIYKATWYADQQELGSITLDDIGYDQTRYLNACADYKLKQESSIWYNSLFVCPNNRLEHIYQFTTKDNGRITLEQGKAKKIKIILEDVYGNTSIVRFSLFYKEKKSNPICTNYLYAAKAVTIESSNLKFNLDSNALYDHVCAQVNTLARVDSTSLSPIYLVANANIPLHNYNPLHLKADRAIPFSLIDKTVIVYQKGSKKVGKKSTYQEGWFSAAVRDFGTYYLAVDSIAPSIKALQAKGNELLAKNKITFKIEDQLSGVQNVEATVNGQWLCFEQHGSLWFYEVDQYCPKGKNILKIKASDACGNETIQNYTLYKP